MNEQISEYISRFPEEIGDLFRVLRGLIADSAPSGAEETLWAKLPSYYAGEAFVRLIPFKDHINIEAKAVAAYSDELKGYKLTPKGMLQIFTGQAIPAEVLKKIFAETLSQNA